CAKGGYSFHRYFDYW
nr:immunoglobulin heavy chain junction region [Mus musculus]